MNDKKINYVAYDEVTGEITQTGTVESGTDFLWLPSGEKGIEGIGKSSKNYVDVNVSVILDKTAQLISQNKVLIIANGLDTSTFTDVEFDAEILIDGVSQGFEEDDDGVVDVTFDTPGVYIIKFVIFPFLDKEFTVNAS